MTTFTTEDRLKAEKCKENHCWHDTPNVLLSYPPITVRVCCNCGIKDTITHQVVKSFEGHGIYHPFNMIITTPTHQTPFQTKYGALFYGKWHRDESNEKCCDDSCGCTHGKEHELPYLGDHTSQTK